jgi:uncharacterized protein (DUF2147 family)
MKRTLLAVAMTMLSSASLAQEPKVYGTWLTASGVAQVRIGPCADPATGALCGFVVGLVDPKGPDGAPVAPDLAVDARNPDPKLRDRKVIGMPLIWGFRMSDDGRTFEGGQIYNGENGKIYSANISWQPDDTLKLRGYVGSPMFGETQIWKRVK